MKDVIFEWSFIRKGEPSKAIQTILVDGEQVIQCYKTVRDEAVITNKRFIVLDVQGVVGKKKEIYSLPFRSIDLWSSETAGMMDLDTEFELWTKQGIVKIKIAAKCDVQEFNEILGNAILNS